MRFIFRLSLFAFVANMAQAEPNLKLRHPLGSGVTHPAFFFSPEENPSALVNDKVTGLQNIYTPAFFGRESSANQLGFASGNGQLGFGATYTYTGATLLGAPVDTHRVASGLGLKIGDWALGASADSPVGGSSSFEADVKLALYMGISGPLHYTLVLDHVTNGGVQPTLGFGYEKENQYSLELSLQTPALSGLGQTGSVYNFGVGATAYTSWFGLAFRANYPLIVGAGSEIFSITQSFGSLVWISKDWSANIFVDSGSTLSLGLTGIF